jgi:hypothetical protein
MPSQTGVKITETTVIWDVWQTASQYTQLHNVVGCGFMVRERERGSERKREREKARERKRERERKRKIERARERYRTMQM